MTESRSSYVETAGFETHVMEWGSPSNPCLVMWHGLARTGRDFDEAAAALGKDYFVLCPDTIGRGLSSWARDAKVDYSYRVFGDIAMALLDHYRVDKLRWVGTSMGGLIGVTLAGGRLKERITHLVINDIGPELDPSGGARIADYVGNPPAYDTVAEFEAWLKSNYAPFGENSDAFWRRMADTSARRLPDGRITAHYDPQIVSQFTHHKGDLSQWEAYDAIKARTFVLRGAESDILSPEIARRMSERGPRPHVELVPGCGHAPTLTGWSQIALLRKFLAS